MLKDIPASARPREKLLTLGPAALADAELIALLLRTGLRGTSVFNFLEGTRNTASKHAAQNSPFRYLLRPRAGGIAFVLDAMGEQMASMLNVTIHYPDGIPTFWELLCGRIPRIVVRFEQIAIPAQFRCCGPCLRPRP